MNLVNRLISLLQRLERLCSREEQKKHLRPSDRRSPNVLSGKILARANGSLPPDAPLDAFEFSVFSQYGEDGIIQHLVNTVKPRIKEFVEIGVENYEESNTRFLVINNYWRGLVVDGSPSNVEFIRRDPLTVFYGLRSACAFIDAENVNAVITDNGFKGEIGLLSIDIDGNDYWIWKAIHCVEPDIVVVEYNALFGPERSVTIPYDREFDRAKASESKLYYGASLGALCSLARQKGYFLVGCNSAGNNAFFVHRKHRNVMREITAPEAFNRQIFNEPSVHGKVPSSEVEKKRLIQGLPLVEV